MTPTPHTSSAKSPQGPSGPQQPLGCACPCHPRLVSGVCPLSGGGQILPYHLLLVASPSQEPQGCDQLILLFSLPAGAACRRDPQAPQAPDLPGAGVWRSRGPVQFQGGPGGGAVLPKGAARQPGRMRGGGGGEGGCCQGLAKTKTEEICTVKRFF